MKPQPYAALLGDLVGSRTSADRGALHRRLLLALDAANAGADVLDPVRVTAGDEFQGVFATVGGNPLFGVVNQTVFAAILLATAPILWRWFPTPSSAAADQQSSSQPI